jgi:hypothetical protein
MDWSQSSGRSAPAKHSNNVRAQYGGGNSLVARGIERTRLCAVYTVERALEAAMITRMERGGERESSISIYRAVRELSKDMLARRPD